MIIPFQRRKAPGKNNDCGLTMVELMVVLVIISILLIQAIHEYMKYIEEARITRAKTDLEELAKAVRLYNIKEDKPFGVGTFTPVYLGTFIGRYIEKAPPFDPWGKPYLHKPQLGALYSRGPDGLDGFSDTATASLDDITVRYLPQDFFITKAELVDANRNNTIDAGDYVEIFFSRPAQMKNVTVFDFETRNPKGALGTAEPVKAAEGTSIKMVFSPPIFPTLKPGETTLVARSIQNSILDFSNPPLNLRNVEEVVIQRRAPR